MAKQLSKNTRIKRLISNVSADHVEDAKRLAEDIIYMQDKLDEARDLYADDLLVETYDNGGGQEGTHENPSISAYQKLLKTYLSALKDLNAMKEQEDNHDVLADIFGY